MYIWVGYYNNVLRYTGDFIPISTLIVLILVALTMSATFSLVETSMLTSRQHRLKSMANQGNKGAKAALFLLEDMDSLLGTVLLWNNFANVSIASLATILSIRLVADNELVLSVTSLLTTLTILILAEITPKAIGVRFAEKVACLAAPVLLLLVRLTPVGKVIRAIVNKAMSSFGEGPNKGPSSRRMIAVEELLALIQDKDTLAEVEQGQKSMIYKLVGMHELTMRDIMRVRSDIEYVDLEDDLEEINSSIRNCDHSLVPLCEDGLENVLGTVKVREALIADLNGTLDKAFLRKLATKAIFVPETIDPIKALRELTQIHSTMCLVVDEYGGLVGLVSINDYYRHIFSSTVGVTADGTSSNKSIVSGETTVREVNLQFGLRLHENEAKTLAGLIVAELGDYPQAPGAVIAVSGANLEVTEIDERQIIKVKITKLSEH